MSRVIDYAWGRPSLASLKAAGAVAVCRYLSYDTSGKNLTRAEADGLRAGGIDIVSNWEQAGSWAEYSGGQAVGRTHAATAEIQHIACGGPVSRPIYFSTDWDVTAGQLATVADYYRGVASVIGLARTGAYGGYRAIRYLFDQHVITWGWQTYAWSGGQWDSRAQLRQVQNGVQVGGVDCDLDESTTTDFGQWSGGTPTTHLPKGDRMLVMAHVRGSNIDWLGDGVFRWQVPDPAHRANALVVMGLQGNPNPTSVEFNPGTLDALGPIVISAADGVPAHIDSLATQSSLLAAMAADVAEVKAVAAQLASTIAAGGGNIDTAAVLARLDEARTDEATALAALRQQMLDLRVDLARVMQASADAFASLITLP